MTGATTTTTTKTLEMMHGIAYGLRIAILANGPSLRSIPYAEVRERNDIIIGVNETHRFGRLDLWVCIDSKPFVASPALDASGWVVNRGILEHDGPPRCVPRIWLPCYAMQNDSRGAVIWPDMTTPQFCRSGTWPDHRVQRKRGQDHHGSSLLMRVSSVLPALHLALILLGGRDGNGGITLYGADCATEPRPPGPRAPHPRRWVDYGEGQAIPPLNECVGQLRTTREALDETRDAWADLRAIRLAKAGPWGVLDWPVRGDG